MAPSRGRSAIPTEQSCSHDREPSRWRPEGAVGMTGRAPVGTTEVPRMQPNDATCAPFLTSAGVAAGLPRRLLDSERYLRPVRGVRAPEPLLGVANRARGLLPVLRPDAAFSHVTAAQLHELPLSYAIDADDRLHFVLPIDAPRVRRPGTVCHRVLHER